MIYRELDLVRVKGKDKPVAIFEPIGLADAVSTQALDALNLYHDALNNYRKQDWAKAEKQLKALELMATDESKSALTALYRQRIVQFKKTPPAKNWDGVFNHDSK